MPARRSIRAPGTSSCGRWRCSASSGSRTGCARSHCETYSATGGIIAVESLAGRELATYVEELNEGVEGFSPTRRVFINQDVLEPLLRERALELGATVRNRTEAVGVEQDGDGVTVDAPRPRLRRRARGPSALRRRRGRQSQPDARAAGDRHARLRTALAQHHDLLPRRLRRVAARPQPGRDLRAQPASCAGSSGSTEPGATASSSSTRSVRTSRRTRRSTCSRD